MVVKKKQNQTDIHQPTHIILSVDYETKLIIPIEKGLEFINTWATARELKEDYNKPKKIQPVDKDFNIKFVSEQYIKELIVEAMIEPDNGD